MRANNATELQTFGVNGAREPIHSTKTEVWRTHCLLYTFDATDEEDSLFLGRLPYTHQKHPTSDNIVFSFFFMGKAPTGTYPILFVGSVRFV